MRFAQEESALRDPAKVLILRWSVIRPPQRQFRRPQRQSKAPVAPLPPGTKYSEKPELLGPSERPSLLSVNKWEPQRYFMYAVILSRIFQESANAADTEKLHAIFCPAISHLKPILQEANQWGLKSSNQLHLIYTKVRLQTAPVCSHRDLK